MKRGLTATIINIIVILLCLVIFWFCAEYIELFKIFSARMIIKYVIIIIMALIVSYVYGLFRKNIVIIGSSGYTCYKEKSPKSFFFNLLVEFVEGIFIIVFGIYTIIKGILMLF